ncbi:hypothetical protein VPFG_00240 [Vibrio phage nt-1]|uniref:Uncharacterized protein n=1 Tax=Vibrio phage nt-1 TaxID=115992 RepID=R9TFI5_9CAUD|nr:hypothetical protein VPFG_00240 [Vibrio phage nt-1]AGN30239.1 hypothetical protein VPFG_00240 [Vibrio phage nt-1]
MIFFNILLLYVFIAVMLYMYSAGCEYAMYKLKGHLDSKFPITFFDTHKMIAAGCFLWLPILMFIVHNEIVNLKSKFKR